MKTKRVLALAALCLSLPAAARAQALPQFLSAVGTGVGAGLAQGAERVAQAMESELEIALDASAPRLEEGQTLTLTVTATNPRAQDTPVTFDLALPDRLSCAQAAEWAAVLPAAEAGADGTLSPSVTTFTRTLTLLPGGTSESVEMTCEMGVGTRFYRARQKLDLCVPDVTVSAQMIGGENGRLQPGDAFLWEIEVKNAGTAPEDVALTLVLPEGVTPKATEGMTRAGSRMNGTVTAAAAQPGEEGLAASEMTVSLPMQVNADALSGDADATRLVAGTLYANGERVPLPRIQVCGAKISAQLSSATDELEPGEETTLRVVVLNEGLAGADVRLACALPAGLEWVREDEALPGAARTPGDAFAPEDTDAAGPDAAPAMIAAAQDGVTQENGALVFSWHMEGAQENENGVTANTDVFDVRVRALEAQDNLRETLVGASLAYSVDGGDMQFGEALALRVHTPSFLGVSRSDWGAIFWACLLMMITVSCLYAAVSAGSAKETYSCE